MRSWILAGLLFFATALVVLWRNATAGVLWDFAFVANTATRIAAGDVPYRDFPMVQAPMVVLVQAGLIKLFGHHFFVTALYAAVTGGLVTALAFRVARWALIGRVANADFVAFALAAPFVLLGSSSLYPHPWYDSEAVWTAFVALSAVIWAHDRPSQGRWLLAGALIVVPFFGKQSIGVGFLGGMYAALALGALVRPEMRPQLTQCLAGSAVTVVAAALAIQLFVGIDLFVANAVSFATAVRPPQILSVIWLAHPLGLLAIGLSAGAVWLAWRPAPINGPIAAGLLVFPFFVIAAVTADLPPAVDLLWPIIVTGGLATMLARLLRGPVDLRDLLPVVAAGMIAGAWLTHGVSRSTRDVWPILVLALAPIVAFVAERTRERRPRFSEVTAYALAVSLIVAGFAYTRSEYALSWVRLEGTRSMSTYPSMLGFGTSGPAATDLDLMLRWIEREVPSGEPIVLIPGEDPVHYALARPPQLPVVTFDEANPYSAEELRTMSEEAGIMWVFVKEDQQIRSARVDENLVAILTRGFVRLPDVGAYRVYRRGPG